MKIFLTCYLKTLGINPMQHSVKFIGEEYERMSTLRKDNPIFKAEQFFDFANKNKKKI